MQKIYVLYCQDKIHTDENGQFIAIKGDISPAQLEDLRESLADSMELDDVNELEWKQVRLFPLPGEANQHAENLESLIDGESDELAEILQPVVDFLRR